MAHANDLGAGLGPGCASQFGSKKQGLRGRHAPSMEALLPGGPEMTQADILTEC
jgi:hypothetical protein